MRTVLILRIADKLPHHRRYCGIHDAICESKKSPIDYRYLQRIGIDEIALRKGHQEYVGVIVDLDQHELVGLVNGRTHAAIEQEQERWGEAVLGQIKEVSID